MARCDEDSGQRREVAPGRGAARGSRRTKRGESTHRKFGERNNHNFVPRLYIIDARWAPHPAAPFVGKTAQNGTSRLGGGQREAHRVSEGHRYHTALGKREWLLCPGPPQAKKIMGSSPISGIFGFAARSLPAASSPISGTSEALAFWPSFRERRSTRLVPCSPWTGPTLASPAGSPSSLSRRPPFSLLPFFLRRFRGALRTDARVGAGPEVCPPRALPIALPREATTGFSEAVPALLSNTRSGGYLSIYLSIWRAETAGGATNAPLPPSKREKSNAQRGQPDARHRKVVRDA